MSGMRIVVGLVLGCLALTACGSSGGGGGELSATQAGAAAAADALGTVTVSRDEAAAAEAVIGPDGGSLTATAADGTVFALTVPPGALPGETTLRAVPSTLEGVDFPTHTVMFEPTGTQFTDRATLAITPAADIAVPDQFMYQLNDDATEFAAAFVDPASTAPIILLDHFSGYGLGQATDPQRAAMLSKGAATAEARIQSQFATVLAADRQAQLAGAQPDGSIGDSLEALSAAYEEEVIKPRLEAAGSSCEATQEAIRTVLGYERSRQLLGLDPSANVDAMQILQDAVNSNGAKCEEEAIKKCKAARDPGILVAYWIGLDRQRQLVGSEGAGFDLDGLIKKARAVCAPSAYEVLEKLPSAPSGTTVKGLICSLAEPFTLRWSGDLTGRATFTPSSEEAGTYDLKVRVGLGSGSGSGSYTVTTDSTGLATSIEIEGEAQTTVPNVGTDSARASEQITLTPTAPCAEQE